MQKDQTKRNLTKPQLAHALNRLQAIYQAATNTVGRNYKYSVDWNNAKEVAGFVKTYDLPEPTWKEFGHYYLNGSMSSVFFNRIDKAVQQRNKDLSGDVDSKMKKVTSLFVAAQDQLIFSEPPEKTEMTKFLAKFEADLSAIVSPA